MSQNLLVEILVEELPPKALRQLGEAFGRVLFEQLQGQGLCSPSSNLTTYASPRRLAAHITAVLGQAPDVAVSHKLMPASVGLNDGKATPALQKKLQALGFAEVNVAELKAVHDG